MSELRFDCSHFDDSCVVKMIQKMWENSSLGLIMSICGNVKQKYINGPWLPDDIQYLIDNYNSNIHISHFVEKFNRSESSIRAKANQLNLHRAIHKNYSVDDFLTAISQSKSHHEASRKLGYDNTQGIKTNSTYSKYLIKYNPDMSHFNKKWECTKEEFLYAISRSRTHLETAKMLGLSSPHSSYYNKLKEYKPNIDHFKGKCKVEFSEQDFFNAIKSSKSHKEAMIKLGYKSPSGKKYSQYGILFIKYKPDTSHFDLYSQTRCESNGGDYKYYDGLSHRSFRSVYNSLLRQAKSRLLPIDLSLEKFLELHKTPCIYCGTDKQSTNKSKTGTPYHGIDRVDSKLGYIEGNCVSCCNICNKMKNNSEQVDFINHIRKIHNYQIKGN